MGTADVQQTTDVLCAHPELFQQEMERSVVTPWGCKEFAKDFYLLVGRLGLELLHRLHPSSEMILTLTESASTYSKGRFALDFATLLYNGFSLWFANVAWTQGVHTGAMHPMARAFLLSVKVINLRNGPRTAPTLAVGVGAAPSECRRSKMGCSVSELRRSNLYPVRWKSSPQ